MHRLIENASLLTLLVVIGLRPLVSESYDSAGQAITAALETVADPSPLRTIIFDVAILVASCGVLLAHVIGCDRMRLYMEVDRPATPLELSRLHDLVARAAHVCYVSNTITDDCEIDYVVTDEATHD